MLFTLFFQQRRVEGHTGQHKDQPTPMLRRRNSAVETKFWYAVILVIHGISDRAAVICDDYIVFLCFLAATLRPLAASFPWLAPSPVPGGVAYSQPLLSMAWLKIANLSTTRNLHWHDCRHQYPRCRKCVLICPRSSFLSKASATSHQRRIAATYNFQHLFVWIPYWQNNICRRCFHIFLYSLKHFGNNYEVYGSRFLQNFRSSQNHLKSMAICPGTLINHFGII